MPCTIKKAIVTLVSRMFRSKIRLLIHLIYSRQLGIRAEIPLLTLAIYSVRRRVTRRVRELRKPKLLLSLLEEDYSVRSLE